MKPEYRLDGELYALYWGDECLFETEVVAVLVDTHSGSMLKHGQPGVVEAYFHSMRTAYLTQGFTEQASSLVVMSGKFDIEDLNKMIAITGYAGQLYAKTMASRANGINPIPQEEEAPNGC